MSLLESAQREPSEGRVAITAVELRRLELPLHTPYWSMISTIHALDPIVVEVHARNDCYGIGECVIVPGYTHETFAGSWEFCRQQAETIVGMTAGDAVKALTLYRSEYSHAVSAMVSAIEMAMRHPALQAQAKERRVPLLAPLHAKHLAEIPNEVEARISEGYRTLKVKVGSDVAADLERVKLIQKVGAGRATIRLDANQGFSTEAGCEFASNLDPEGVELLEQPCAADDWGAAVRVKQVSTVPMMLDESIFDETDIERAARLEAADYIKLKLVKMGGIDALQAGIDRILSCRMGAVSGNGVATEIGNWMEACVSAGRLSTVGEMNGYLKSNVSLFRNPLQIEGGAIVIPAGYFPVIDRSVIHRHTVLHERYS